MGAESNSVFSILYLGFLAALFYFVFWRPHKKRQKDQKAMVDSLTVNAKVVTVGGIYGTITKVTDQDVMLRVADKVEIRILKSSVGKIISE